MNVKMHGDIEQAENRSNRLALLDRTIRAAGAQRILYSAVLANKLGLRQIDLECLFIITLNDKVTPGRLADETGLTTGAITGIIDRLEKGEFIKRVRDSSDRRRIFLEPVAKRIAEIRAANRRMHELWKRDLANYSDDELEVLLDFANRNYRSAVDATIELRSEDNDRGSVSITRLPDRIFETYQSDDSTPE